MARQRRPTKKRGGGRKGTKRHLRQRGGEPPTAEELLEGINGIKDTQKKLTAEVASMLDKCSGHLEKAKELQMPTPTQATVRHTHRMQEELKAKAAEKKKSKEEEGATVVIKEGEQEEPVVTKKDTKEEKPEVTKDATPAASEEEGKGGGGGGFLEAFFSGGGRRRRRRKTCGRAPVRRRTRRR